MTTKHTIFFALCLAALGLLGATNILSPIQPQAYLMAGGITANTTSSAFSGIGGYKTFYGQVVGTGAVTQTQAIYGDIDNDAANGILLCTLTLSGTTRAQDACATSTSPWTHYYIITTNTTGTGATGAVYAIY